MRHESKPDGRVWAITCYFPFDDPVGLKRRLRVYREFRRHLRIPLVTVELSQDGAFDLDESDAEILIRVRGGALLWQKERLLNRAVEALPQHCDTVAWMDCDVVIGSADWAEQSRELLQRVPMLQPFRTLYHLASDALPEPGAEPPCFTVKKSLAYLATTGPLPDQVFQTHGSGKRLKHASGMAWVAAKESLERYQLYDAGILGGGDKLIFSAAFGRQADSAVIFRMAARHREHYYRWARPFHEHIGARIGCLDGDAYHLWHGDLTHRQYNTRHDGFDAFHFDPYVDIARNPDGAWTWNSDKPDMHEFVSRLFERRQQGSLTPPDGAAAAAQYASAEDS